MKPPSARGIPARAEILAVGTELTSGPRVDTNSAWLRRRLALLDLRVSRVTCVPDELAVLTAELKSACRRSRLVLLTGGLGPTEDDRTLQALAAAAGVGLRLRPQVRAWLEKGRRRPGTPLPPALLRQARLPVGATPLRNGRGTAPGVLLTCGRSLVVALPGVPDEMRGLWQDHVEAELRRRWPASRVSHVVMVVGGRRESEVDALAAPICREEDVTLTTLASGGAVELHLGGTEQAVGVAAERIERLLPGDVVSRDGSSLEETVLAAARLRGGTIAVAESCTGGRVAGRLTAIAGASDVFLGSLVTYADALKRKLLRVPAGVLDRDGAVSEAAVQAMATGVRRATGCTWSVAVSGIAGPAGGTRSKPVGVVWFATAGPRPGMVLKRQLPGGRERVQDLAAGLALDLLRRTILAPGAAS